MTDKFDRVLAVEVCIQEWIDEQNLTLEVPLMIARLQLRDVAKDITAVHEEKFYDLTDIDTDAFVKNIKLGWNERLIKKSLFPQPEVHKQHFTETEHGIDATVTVWSKGFDPESGPDFLVSYVDGLWSADIRNRITKFQNREIVSKFYFTPEYIKEDGDFSAEIFINRPENDDDSQDLVEVWTDQDTRYCGEMIIYFKWL